MILSHQDCQTITADVLQDNFTDYTTARITINLDCCDSQQYFFEILDLTSTVPTDDIYVDGNNNFIINSTLFGGTITDAVYSVEIIMYQLNGANFEDTGCIFVDCNTKCKVAELIKTLQTEEEKTEVLMKHYSLTVGSNCSCECDSLCNIHRSLKEDLTGIDYDCGCV